jgi:DNA-binding transcriptional ArsR family regulator
MEDERLSRTMRIDSPERAAVFTDPKRRRILTAFMGRERSLSEAAEALAMPMNRLAHHVGSFLRLGLLAVTRERKRAGRPIRYYRAAADAFVVPAALMGRRAGDGLAAELRKALAEAETLAGASDIMLSLDGEGRPLMSRSGGEREADACEYWRVLPLGRSEARALAGELRALLHKYERPTGKGAVAYLAHVALAPRRRD